MIHEQYPEGREGYRRAETESETYEPREYRQSRETSETRRRADTGEYQDVERGYDEPKAYRESRGYEEPRTYRERGREREHEETPTEVQTVFSTSGINIIAGLWLILAPFALGYSNVEAAVWNSIILGIAIGLMAIVRVVRPLESEGVSWVNFVLGIWLLVSPFVLGLANIEALVWNNIIVGVIVLALAATSAMATRRFHDPTAGSHRGSRRHHRSRV